MRAVLKCFPYLLAAAGGLAVAGGVPQADMAPAERDLLVAARRLSRGAAVACDDFRAERIEARRAPARALQLPCDVAPGSVALREIATHDVIRSHDIGIAPAVMAGSFVQVATVAGAVRVTAKALALADAHVGDTVAVRLANPRRIVRAHVTAPGAVELEATQP